jgi:aspartate carbamoyltransferase catalytic subunit
LGASIINWDADSSSIKKNESFSDTIATLAQYDPDAIVIRHSNYGAPDYVASQVQCPVIYAGDSWREHPTQALLDAESTEKEESFSEISVFSVANPCSQGVHT